MKLKYGILGFMLGALLIGLTPTAMAAGTSTIDKIFKKVKVSITKIDTVKSKVDDVQSDVTYTQKLNNDMYKNAYYQSELLNNIAYNTYASCLYSGVNPDYCEDPTNYLISTNSLFNYDVSLTSLSAQSGKQKVDSSKVGNIDELKKLLLQTK